MLAIVAGVANYFGKSNYGMFHLDIQRKVEGVGEGIKSNLEIDSRLVICKLNQSMHV